jgi:homopolymeric O-antigen transport system permease protein
MTWLIAYTTMSTPTLNPLRIYTDIWRHRYLFGQLVRHDVLLKYKGAYLNIIWSYLYRLLLLVAFTLDLCRRLKK